jgi:hypothetical protein
LTLARTLLNNEPAVCLGFLCDTRGDGSKGRYPVGYTRIGDHLIYLVFYVDDMLLIGNNKEIIQDVKTQLYSKFDMKDIGALNFILGM